MTREEMKDFKPIKDLVLVKVEIPELKTESGIILKTQRSVIQDRPTSGLVEAIGSDVKQNLIGKKVHFEKTRGQDIAEGYIVLSEEHILGYES